MPRRDREDEFDDSDRETDPPFPGVVRAAAVMWIVLGGLFLIGSFLSYFVLPVVLGLGHGGMRKPAPTEGCSFFIGIALGAGFLVVGIRTVKGSARDVVAGSVLSLLVALVYVSFGVLALLIALSGNAPAFY